MHTRQRTRSRAVLTVTFIGVVFVALLASPALADNCDLRINPEDCRNTAWTVGTVAAIVAAITAILVALSGLGTVEAGAEGAGPAAPAAPARTIGQVASGGPPRDPPPGHPSIRRQDANDSCALVSIQMIHERITGDLIPQNTLRAQSHQMPNGYRNNPGKWGTSTEAAVDQLRGLGHDASKKNLTPEEMQKALDEGKQVTVSVNGPGGGAHRVLVSGIEQRGGRRVITFDDPWTGQQFQRTDVWWGTNGNPDRTIVVAPK